jgi:hypothetical protein
VHAHVDADFLLCSKDKRGAKIAGWKPSTVAVGKPRPGRHHVRPASRPHLGAFKALFGPTEAVLLPRTY